MIDNFSTKSDLYAKYRPSYPAELFEFINSLVANKERAWDCGTGTGLLASELAKTFKEVYATDISQSQLDNAVRADNIFYSLQPSEKTNFKNNQFDVITVAQAIHWFDFDKFYDEVRRVAKKDSILCVAGYAIIRISDEIDNLIDEFFHKVLGQYWDKERKYLDEHYRYIPFPFEEIQTPEYENKLKWTMEHFIGYLNTWSAVRHFIKDKGFNPVDDLIPEISKNWGDKDEKDVRFPILLRIGRI